MMPRILVLEANVETVMGVLVRVVAVLLVLPAVVQNGSGREVAVDYCREGKGRRHTASSRDDVDETAVAVEGGDNIHCDSFQGAAAVEGHRHRAAVHTDDRGDGVGAAVMIGGEAVEAAVHVHRYRDCCQWFHWFPWFDPPDETVLVAVVAAFVVRRGVSTFDPIVPDVVAESFWNVEILVDIPDRFPGGDRVVPCGDPWCVIECEDVWRNIPLHSRPWLWPW